MMDLCGSGKDLGGEKGLGGRKQREDLWKYFEYNPGERRTVCVVEVEGSKCGHKLGGKNTTNLKRHLKSHTFILSSMHTQLTASLQLLRFFIYDFVLEFLHRLKMGRVCMVSFNTNNLLLN